MIILRLLLLLTNLHLKLLSTQGTGADKLLSTQRVKNVRYLKLSSFSLVIKNNLTFAITYYFNFRKTAIVI